MRDSGIGARKVSSLQSRICIEDVPISSGVYESREFATPLPCSFFRHVVHLRHNGVANSFHGVPYPVECHPAFQSHVPRKYPDGSVAVPFSASQIELANPMLSLPHQGEWQDADR